MGTPLKTLPVILSPRVLSPFSPKLLSVPKKYENFINLPQNSLGERSNHVVKKLDFSQNSSPNHLIKPIQVKITDYTQIENELSTTDVEINTPNKINISQNGVDGNRKHTVLGIGSFGKVIRGIHKGKTVAVKVVKNSSTIGERNALNLDHENIVKTLEIVQKQEGTYSLIIMEYFPNSKQLQTLLEDPNFEMGNKIINFALDICQGLDFIHQKGILHLDLKPQNILVAETICKICDFGNSVLKNETENFSHQGTAVYTGPELLQGKSPTEKCDIYSLGILFWQLKSRCLPYSDIDNAETVIYKVVKCNCRPENAIPIDDFSKLYQSCWDADPCKRPCVWNILLKLKEMV